MTPTRFHCLIPILQHIIDTQEITDQEAIGIARLLLWLQLGEI